MTGIVLRPAQPTDAGATGAILSAFAIGTDWMPRIHTAAEDIGFAGMMIERGWVHVAETDGDVTGFIACADAEIQALYVASNMCGRGIGSALLQQVQSQATRLSLWTFQANTRAQQFYKRHGFKEVARTDGARNDEKLPDMRMLWTKEGT
ncbi:GNAT family N-acetyltransferase [uncultured Tateyamaria sp.]|uniref:GNAT family N-acetyltransferase n=1 Tax=Tateyamaria sp. 1078 TaxID=3417464 RepID=UPI0026112666|nr:GNAT family N-acetyltransferase [uncultured Tateyamaria sp.]